MDVSISNYDFLKYLPERQRLHFLLLTQNAKKPEPEHWELAAELIELGMARGRVLRESESGRKEIFELLAFETTAQGRNYAEELQMKAIMNSPQYKHLQRWRRCKDKFLGWLAGVASSVAASIVTEWSTGAISRLLLAGC